MKFVRGVVSAVRFDDRVYCQTCGYDVLGGKIVISPTGRAYCEDDGCCESAAVTGDEVGDPRVGGQVYSSKGRIGFAVGGGRLVYFGEPSLVRRSGR